MNRNLELTEEKEKGGERRADDILCSSGNSWQKSSMVGLAQGLLRTRALYVHYIKFAERGRKALLFKSK